MKNLTLREKIGQMLIIKIQGKEITNETKRMIEEYKVGGIILYRKNYDTYEEMINLINEIKKVNHKSGNMPLFISIDQEGGRVNRMPRELKNIKSAGKLVAKDNIEIIEQAVNYAGEVVKCSAMAFNGDDAIGLFKGETLIDLMGTQGVQEKFGENVVLRRVATVTSPNTTYTLAEWHEVKLTSAEDDASVGISGLGSHTVE